jgi:hypothetical protein
MSKIDPVICSRSRISNQSLPKIRGVGRRAKHWVLSSHDFPLSLALQVTIATKVSLQLWVDIVLMATFDKQPQESCSDLTTWVHLAGGAWLEGYENIGIKEKLHAPPLSLKALEHDNP